MNIQDLSDDLAEDKARQESRRCKCAERKAAGKPVPCAACRVAAFKRMSSGSGGDCTWSDDISAPVGVRKVM